MGSSVGNSLNQIGYKNDVHSLYLRIHVSTWSNCQAEPFSTQLATAIPFEKEVDLQYRVTGRSVESSYGPHYVCTLVYAWISCQVYRPLTIIE